jgi:IS5 family transposase
MYFYCGFSYRDMEDWLLVSDTIYRSLHLKAIPDHTTLCRAFHKLSIGLLRFLQRLLLERMQLKEFAIGVDSTGFRTDQVSA